MPEYKFEVLQNLLGGLVEVAVISFDFREVKRNGRTGLKTRLRLSGMDCQQVLLRQFNRFQK